MLPSPIDTSLSYHPFKTTPTNTLQKYPGSNLTNHLRKKPQLAINLYKLSFPFSVYL